jgi:hypothetical protein
MKTFHHLKVGEAVTLQHYRVNADLSCEVLGTVAGIVTEVRVYQVVVKTSEELLTFSRRSGDRWNAQSEDFCIHPQHSLRRKKKT